MPSPAQQPDLQQLCALHYAPLHAHVQRKLPQRSDADDLVQETWLRVLKVDTGNLLRNGRAYLYRVAHNLIVDFYRQRQRSLELQVDDSVCHAVADLRPAPDQHYLHQEQLRHLDAIITALPPRSRQVFVLARVEAMSVAEIARHLGITRQTAHGHLLRALLALQQVDPHA